MPPRRDCTDTGFGTGQSEHRGFGRSWRVGGCSPRLADAARKSLPGGGLATTSPCVSRRTNAEPDNETSVRWWTTRTRRQSSRSRRGATREPFRFAQETSVLRPRITGEVHGRRRRPRERRRRLVPRRRLQLHSSRVARRVAHDAADLDTVARSYATRCRTD